MIMLKCTCGAGDIAVHGYCQKCWDREAKEKFLKKFAEEARKMIGDRRRYNKMMDEVRKDGNGFFDFDTFKKRFRFERVR